MDIPDTIEREMTLTAPVERVWAALTDPKELVKWFGDGAEVDLRPGGAMLLSFGHDRVPAVVEAVEPMRRFAYWWTPGDGSGQPVTEESRTLVDFTLAPTADGGTKLRMVESGFAAHPDKRAGNDEGWTAELGELATYLEAA